MGECTLGVNHVFSSSGSDLRWRATLSTTDSSATPEIYSVSISYATVVSAVKENGISEKYALSPENPYFANGEYIIPVNNPSLTGNSHVMISIYDIQGKLINQLNRGTENSSRDSFVRWNGKDNTGRYLQSGMYLFKITSGSHTLVTRSVFAR